MLENLVLIVDVLVALVMVGLILLQQGKGAEMGASFGSGSSQTVFGSAGSASFLTKVTWWLAMVFFACSLALAFFAHQRIQAAGTTIPGLDVTPPPATTAAALKPMGDVPVVPSAPASLKLPGSTTAAPAPVPVTVTPVAGATPTTAPAVVPVAPVKASGK